MLGVSGVSSEESDGDPSGELAGVAAELVGGPLAAAFTRNKYKKYCPS